MCVGAGSNLFCGGTYKDEFFNLVPKGLDPLVVGGILVISASDEVGGTLHCLYGLDGSVGICALAVIVKSHALLFTDKLDAVGHGMKRLKSLHYAVSGSTVCLGHCYCCHDIFIVVHT